VQNGIDHPERLARVVGAGPLVGGVALLTAAITAPGVVAQTAGRGKIVLGELDGRTSDRIERLRTTLEHAGIPAEVRPDIWAALWEKFIFICAFGGVTALTRLPIGPILASAAGSALLHGVMEEVAAVAQVGGIALPGDSTERGMALVRGFEPWARGSLYHDLAAGRRLEVEMLNGTVVRLGREGAVPTPFNFVIYAALQPYAAGTPVLP
jgi:2-dehydropantoate 2-reductase